MEKQELKPILEALIFASEDPITISGLCLLLQETGVEKGEVDVALQELKQDYNDKIIMNINRILSTVESNLINTAKEYIVVNPSLEKKLNENPDVLERADVPPHLEIDSSLQSADESAQMIVDYYHL